MLSLIFCWIILDSFGLSVFIKCALNAWNTGFDEDMLIGCTTAAPRRKSLFQKKSQEKKGWMSLMLVLSWFTIRPWLNATLLFQSHPVDRKWPITGWVTKTSIHFPIILCFFNLGKTKRWLFCCNLYCGWYHTVSLRNCWTLRGSYSLETVCFLFCSL